jgi:hypothetical protein
VRLRLVYIDFWSAVKLSFLVAIAIAIVTLVFFVLLFLVIESTGLIAQVDEFIGSFSGGRFSIAATVGLPQVFAFGSVVAILNLIVVTVMGAISAGIYNMCVKITGGLLVGLTSN